MSISCQRLSAGAQASCCHILPPTAFSPTAPRSHVLAMASTDTITGLAGMQMSRRACCSSLWLSDHYWNNRPRKTGIPSRVSGWEKRMSKARASWKKSFFLGKKEIITCWIILQKKQWPGNMAFYFYLTQNPRGLGEGAHLISLRTPK